MFKAIDLFAGCGGFSTGFRQAKFDVIIAVEFDKEIAQSYKHNHPKTKMLIDDIKNIDNQKFFNKNMADVIIGGPPCQGFSMSGARIRKKFANTEDKRNYLFKHYLNIVNIVRPKLFIFENVKGIISFNKGLIFDEIKESFKSIGYFLQYFVVDCSLFGIPQKRERTILIGSLFDFNLKEEIDKTKKYILKNNSTFFNKVSVWDAIGNLKEPTQDGIINNAKALTSYQKYLSSDNKILQNHIATNHNLVALKRIKKIKQNENFKSLKEKIKSVHSGSYGRLSINEVSPTITTRFDTPSAGRFIHPYANRTITPREAARIQSFPDNFEFIGTKSSICKQIGNAVPPKVAYFFAVMIRRLLNECK